MKIKGLQKTTLIDYPGEVACTIFLFGCNFRCGFCHNPELVLKDEGLNISEKEILGFLDKRKDYLEGICITGGEPLMTIEKNFLKEVKNLGYKIKLDTNGSFPDKLKEFIDEKLINFISMDIKSGKEKYKDITNSEIDVSLIEKSIRIIADSKLDYEFRTTIIEEFHDKKEIINIAKWLNELIKEKPKKYILQGFKNYGKFIDPSFRMKDNTSEKYLNELKNEINDYFKEIEIRY
ncbi:MAG: anaerobic ribonucleoside-triphosphate reductase activating protein [Minisyncoccales bacterium]